MKRVLLALVCVMGFTGYANAQSWAWGPKVGATFSSASGVDDVKMREGVVAGLFAERAVNNWLVMEADLMFAQYGYDVESDPETRYRLDYLTIPIVGKYYLMDGLSFQLGAQFGYQLGAKEKADGESTRSVGSHFNKFDIMFVSGMAYDFPVGLVLEGRYLYGMTQLTPSVSNVRSGSLQIAAGWRF